MTFYALVIPDKQESLHAVGRDRADALGQFAKELKHGITDSENVSDGNVAPYLLDEWERNPHWVRPTIPIFKVRS